MIENLSKKIALYFTSQENSDKNVDSVELIAYGIECIINTSIPLILYLTWGIIHHKIIYTIIWFSVFIILRNNIGGYHADSHKKCIIYSCMYGLAFLYLIDKCSSFSVIIYIVAVIFSLILHTILKPIIGHKEDECSEYLRKLKSSATKILLLALIVIVCVYSHFPLCSATITLGIISADILFVVQKIKGFMLYKNNTR